MIPRTRTLLLGCLVAVGCGGAGPSVTTGLTTLPGLTNDPSNDDDDDDDDDDDGTPPGSATQACIDGTCLGDLICQDDVCIDPAQPPTTGPTTGTTGPGQTDPDPDTGPADPGSSDTGTTDPTDDSTSDPTSDPTRGDEPMFCAETCDVDADCKYEGDSYGLVCYQGVCTVGPHCESTGTCVAQSSGWNVACTSQVDCPGQACIDIGDGVGRCATVPSDFLSCATLQQDETYYPPIEGGEPIAVCAVLTTVCSEDGVCISPCKSDAYCFTEALYPVCDLQSGMCVCGSDADCAQANDPGRSVCNDGRCGCGDDDDCAASGNADICFDGRCGCSSTAVCGEAVYDGTVVNCQSP